MKSAIPQLMFHGQVEKALTLWARAFPDMQVMPGAPARVVIAGQELRLLDSDISKDTALTPAFSLVVACDDASEVELITAILSEGGKVLVPLGEYEFSPCFAWISDAVGMNWQVMVEP